MPTRRDEFVANVNRAIGSLKIQVAADSDKLDATQLSQILSSCDIWLTPKSVEGFDPDDFPELSTQDRAVLQSEVAAFLRVANSVPQKGPATEQQACDGMKHLLAAAKLLGLLQ